MLIAVKLSGIYVCHWANSNKFFAYFLTIYMQRNTVLSFIEDKDAAFFIKSKDICASDEDLAFQNGGGIIENLTENYLNAPAKAVFSDERQITAD